MPSPSVRAAALIYNRLPGAAQHLLLGLAHRHFLVGVVGVGVDAGGRFLLARHRFGSHAWRFPGGLLDRAEDPAAALAREIREETGLRIEVGPVLSAGNDRRWSHVELVFAYRVTEAPAVRSTDELLEVGMFELGALPPMRRDHREVLERHAARATGWAAATAIVDEVDHVVLTVADVDATISFYERALGLVPVTFGDGRRALAFGAQKLNLHQAGREFIPHAARPVPGSVDICLRTGTPLADVARRLDAAGVGLELGPVPKTGARGALRSIYFRDPDGNLIEVANEVV